MKMKILTTSLLGVALATLSTPTVHANAPKTPLYIGAALGGNAMTGSGNIAIAQVVGGGPFPQGFNTNLSDKNIAGDLFIGLGKRFNCAWLGVEILGSLTSLNSKSGLDITDSGSNQNLSVKTTNAFGGALNLGYFINAMTKLYVKLGVENRNFKINFSQPDNASPTPALTKNRRRTAFVPGFGIETDVNHRISVRGEYRAALHPRKTDSASSNTPGFSTTVKTKPTIHYFMLGLTVKI